jgi:hypothetical protein
MRSGGVFHALVACWQLELANRSQANRCLHGQPTIF